MDLREYARMLRTYWKAIAALTLAGALLAFAWSAIQPRVYTADANGYVSVTTSDGSTGSALAGDSLTLSRVKSYVDIGTWRSVAQHAIDELGLDVTPEQLVSQVTVTNPTDTVNIHVSAEDSTPEGARNLAEAWIRGMAAEIDEIESSSTGAEGGSGAVQLIAGDSARLPSSPSSPNTRLNVALGVAIGLLLGVVYALVRRTFDRRLRTAKETEQAGGVAVVGTLPVEKTLAGERRVFSYEDVMQDTESFAHREAVRELRANLQYVDVDHPPRVIVVTSPLPGDGKSTTAANLAMSIAASGKRVLLIDADLRRPVQAAMFGHVNDIGLSDLLAGQAEVGDVARQIDPAGNLFLIGAGHAPPNPSEMLGSQRMRQLLAQLREEMIVIIDSPPTIPVADAAVLSAASDGVLLVISAGKTTIDMLQKAIENVGRGGGRVLGVVLNRVPRRGPHAGYYGKRYATYYGTAEGSASRRSGRSGRSGARRAGRSARGDAERRPGPMRRGSTDAFPETEAFSPGELTAPGRRSAG